MITMLLWVRVSAVNAFGLSSVASEMKGMADGTYFFIKKLFIENNETNLINGIIIKPSFFNKFNKYFTQ